MEPILEAKSLDDLGTVPIIVVIPRPDGKRVAVKMRALSDEEVWQVRANLKRISPPVKDIQRVNGKITTLYDYEHPDYLHAVESQNRDFAARCILRMLTTLNVPGDTEDEQIKNFQIGIGNYAFAWLLREANRINNIEEGQAEHLADSFLGEREANSTNTEGLQPDSGKMVGTPENGEAVSNGV